MLPFQFISSCINIYALLLFHFVGSMGRTCLMSAVCAFHKVTMEEGKFGQTRVNLVHISGIINEVNIC